MKVQRIVIFIALIGAAALIAYRQLHHDALRTAKVVRGSIIDAVYASGPVEPRERVEVKARVAGPIGALLVQVGQHVKRGDRLAWIDAPTLAYDVARGRVDLNAARERAQLAPQVEALRQQAASLKAQLDQARLDLTRVEGLARTGAGTQQDLEHARTPVATLERQIAANEAQQQDLRIALRADAGRHKAGVAALRARQSDVDVRAPMDGVVLWRHVEPGEIVAPQQNLLRVGDLSHLWIEAHVDEADIGRVREQMPAAVRLYAHPGQSFRGRVARILPDADRERKSFEVDIDLSEPVPALRPGMTAEVNIIMQERSGALLVPADAVHEHHVWVLSGGVLQRRDVEIGVRDLVRVEISGGLAEGERVVLEDERRLREGLAATAKEEP